MDLALLQHDRYGHDEREFGQVALEIVAHTDYRSIPVAHQDHLRGFVEQFCVGFPDVEAAKPGSGRGQQRERERGRTDRGEPAAAGQGNEHRILRKVGSAARNGAASLSGVKSAQIRFRAPP